MKYHLPLMVAVVLAGCALQAQPANPLSDEARKKYTSIRDPFLEEAEKMAEENYSFKPTPGLKRTFGQLVAHIADEQALTCSEFLGKAKSVNAASKTKKADILAALKEAFDTCDRAYDSLTDATASQVIKMGRGQRSKIGALYGNTINFFGQSGEATVYLRLKGVPMPCPSN